MINKTLFVYNSLNLFEILSETKENFYFEIKYIDTKDHKNVNFGQYDNYLILSTNDNEKIKDCIIIDDLPKKITNLIEAESELLNLNVNYHTSQKDMILNYFNIMALEGSLIVTFEKFLSNYN